MVVTAALQAVALNGLLCLGAVHPPMAVRHRRCTATASAEAESEEWGALDSWLQQGSQQPKRRRVLPERTVLSAEGRQLPFFDALSFAQLGTSDGMDAGLSRCGFKQPSVVQAAAFSPIFNGEDVIIAHPPGSGKTLAYCLPLISRLLETDAVEGPTPDGHVRAIVLVPSSELAMQTLQLMRGLANRKLRITVATGGNKWQTQRERAADGLEVLIATFGRLRAHLQKGSVSLSEVRHIVIDEFDLVRCVAIRTRDLWIPSCCQCSRLAFGHSCRQVYRDARLLSVWTELRAQLPPSAAISLATSTLPDAVTKQVASAATAHGVPRPYRCSYPPARPPAHRPPCRSADRPIRRPLPDACPLDTHVRACPPGGGRFARRSVDPKLQAAHNAPWRPRSPHRLQRRRGGGCLRMG